MVTIPRSGNPSFRHQYCLCHIRAGCSLQSHARAIRHSDPLLPTSCPPGAAVTIPRSGNPSFRRPRAARQELPGSVTIPRSGNPSFRLLCLQYSTGGGKRPAFARRYFLGAFLIGAERVFLAAILLGRLAERGEKLRSGGLSHLPLANRSRGAPLLFFMVSDEYDDIWFSSPRQLLYRSLSSLLQHAILDPSYRYYRCQRPIFEKREV